MAGVELLHGPDRWLSRRGFPLRGATYSSRLPTVSWPLCFGMKNASLIAENPSFGSDKPLLMNGLGRSMHKTILSVSTILALTLASTGCIATRKHVKSVSDPLDRRIGGLEAKSRETDATLASHEKDISAADERVKKGLTPAPAKRGRRRQARTSASVGSAKRRILLGSRRQTQKPLRIRALRVQTRLSRSCPSG